MASKIFSTNPLYCTIINVDFGFSLLLINNKLLLDSLINSFTTRAECYEQKINYQRPSSDEINLAKFNEL